MYDVIIIGAGPAGLTAGLYAGRARLNTLIFEQLIVGGQVALTQTIENFPGFPGEIKTEELIERLTKQVNDLGIKIANAQIKEISSKGREFILVDSEDKEHYAKTIILATGAQPKKINVPGEDKLIGRGVSYCAVCDGPLYKEKDIVVVGGGDRAVEEAIFLSRFAKTIKLVHRRDSLRATKILQEHLKKNTKITVVWNSVVTEILGENKVEAVKIKDVKTEKESTINCHGVFLAIGVTPNTQFLNGIIKTDEFGYIITAEDLMTSLPGLFACGDCRRRPLLQVVTACAEGALAAFSADKYLESL
ncbi:MAG: thioredoxin-disulfide reductase [Candidatus Omnitrophota bacterium]|nr:thioredoxin-disulfide reductase [Candidatus Omnitrophota bacterium]